MLRLDLLENLLEKLTALRKVVRQIDEKLTALRKVVRQIDETPMRDDINF